MTTIRTNSSRRDVEHFLRSLPAILTGKAADPYGIAKGMRARVGFATLQLIKLDFEEKGRGRTGSDGTTWPALSKQYLAYQRPVVGRKPPRAGKKAPGGKDGFLTNKQLKEWRQIYARQLARFARSMELEAAKGRAAAYAWKVMKAKGARTKLEVFGNRRVGVDYQTLVDTGTLRNSLTPGQLNERGPAATYSPNDSEQVFREGPASVVVGTSVKYAKYHHDGKRRLWPERFPDAWWDEITGAVVSGIERIGDLIKGGRI